MVRVTLGGFSLADGLGGKRSYWPITFAQVFKPDCLRSVYLGFQFKAEKGAKVPIQGYLRNVQRALLRCVSHPFCTGRGRVLVPSSATSEHQSPYEHSAPYVHRTWNSPISKSDHLIYPIVHLLQGD